MRICQVVVLSATLFVYPGIGRSQEQGVSPRLIGAAPNYPNTTEGLRQLLQDMRTAANGNENKLATFVKNMEIPNCAAWLHKMYESDKADSWMGLCDAKVRDPKEREMTQLFVRLAKQDGKILTRKVNDNPQSGRGLEWGWLQAIKQPLDIYWASWLPANEPDESEADPIGYFMFIDGAFRWECTIQSYKRSQIQRTAKIVLPKQIEKVDPIYPAEAAARGVSGTVRVYYAIGTDGLVYDARAVSGEGLSDDLTLRKAAEDAVRQWRYQPLTVDGKPERYTTTADVNFTLHP